MGSSGPCHRTVAALTCESACPSFSTSVIDGVPRAFLHTRPFGDVPALLSPGSRAGTLTTSSFSFQKLQGPRGLPRAGASWTWVGIQPRLFQKFRMVSGFLSKSLVDSESSEMQLVRAEMDPCSRTDLPGGQGRCLPGGRSPLAGLAPRAASGASLLSPPSPLRKYAQDSSAEPPCLLLNALPLGKSESPEVGADFQKLLS